ncbi:MAG: 4Fe-4S dicluster domain-containing protein [Lachnospiraceae bacterium]|nr:4Fe-4S dicluster domain-containing protein [Lachnospiraceae bacterium]
MIYRDFQGIKLSALGFGSMRLPVIDGDDSRIDEAAALRMVDTAMKSGINYYDTAWGYHGENSEPLMGKALSRYPRESFYVATKFPGYDPHNWRKVKEIFESQLEKLGVDYFDFYLFHNVCEMNIDAYLNDEKYGIYTYLMEQKKNGRIKHLGFSCHGKLDVLKRFLDAYGKDMEFCQLQINFLDWTFQGAKEKVDLLNEWKIPVWVMEPLRGGKLARLAPEYEEQLKALRPDEEIPAWSFRFLQSIPTVTMILSGMSDEKQLEDNLKTFETDRKLNDEEMKVLMGIADKMLSAGTVPCTACHYCVSHCPQGLDIPNLISLYNEHVYTGGGFLAPMAIGALPIDKRPQSCLHCRSCEQVCPQQIKISEIMEDFSAKLG